MTPTPQAETHRCTACGDSFSDNVAFEQHPCVKALEKLSIEELMALYSQSHQAPKPLFTVDQVLSVYSGKAHKCCCGCAGKHTYASKLRAIAELARGYPIEDKEVNDRSVALICQKIMDGGGKLDVGHAYLETPTRLYIAYLNLA